MNTNVMTNVPLLSHLETVFDNFDTASYRRHRLRHGQKLDDFICAILRKRTAPGAKIFDPCMTIGSVAKACMLKSNDRAFIGCESSWPLRGHDNSIGSPYICRAGAQFCLRYKIETCFLHCCGAVPCNGKGFKTSNAEKGMEVA